MNRPDNGHPIPDTRVPDTEQRRRWREAAKRRYHFNEEARLAKIAAVEEYRERHPERAREANSLARKRSRRGIQRAYRKVEAGGQTP